jgi:hypothetical protein
VGTAPSNDAINLEEGGEQASFATTPAEDTPPAEVLQFRQRIAEFIQEAKVVSNIPSAEPGLGGAKGIFPESSPDCSERLTADKPVAPKTVADAKCSLSDAKCSLNDQEVEVVSHKEISTPDKPSEPAETGGEPSQPATPETNDVPTKLRTPETHDIDPAEAEAPIATPRWEYTALSDQSQPLDGNIPPTEPASPNMQAAKSSPGSPGSLRKVRQKLSVPEISITAAELVAPETNAIATGSLAPETSVTPTKPQDPDTNFTAAKPESPETSVTPTEPQALETGVIATIAIFEALKASATATEHVALPVDSTASLLPPPLETLEALQCSRPRNVQRSSEPSFTPTEPEAPEIIATATPTEPAALPVDSIASPSETSGAPRRSYHDDGGDDDENKPFLSTWAVGALFRSERRSEAEAPETSVALSTALPVDSTMSETLLPPSETLEGPLPSKTLEAPPLEAPQRSEAKTPETDANATEPVALTVDSTASALLPPSETLEAPPLEGLDQSQSVYISCNFSLNHDLN